MNRLKNKILFKIAKMLQPNFDPKETLMDQEARNNWLRRFYLESSGPGEGDRPKVYVTMASDYHAQSDHYVGTPTDKHPANLITSGMPPFMGLDTTASGHKKGKRYQKDDSIHSPVLDIDVPCTLWPSRQPGHYHLLIDKELSWSDYTDLLENLSKHGIIETGFKNASISRGFSGVRLPPEELVTEKLREWTLAQEIFDV